MSYDEIQLILNQLKSDQLLLVYLTDKDEVAVVIASLNSDLTQKSLSNFSQFKTPVLFSDGEKVVISDDLTIPLAQCDKTVVHNCLVNARKKGNQ